MRHKRNAVSIDLESEAFIGRGSNPGKSGVSRLDYEGDRPDATYMTATSKPDQLIRCDFNDALRMIDLLPEPEKSVVRDVMNSESIVGYAEDFKTSLFDAMSMMKRARSIMNRLAEDIADEKKEIAHGDAKIKA